MHIGFYLAAAYNIVGMLVMTRGFTNTLMFETDPQLFSAPACAVIVIWGLAYASLARSYAQAPLVAGVFALEKLFYGVWWIRWLILHGDEVPDLLARDLFTGVFYATYGAGDLAFGAFFAWVWWRHR